MKRHVDGERANRLPAGRPVAARIVAHARQHFFVHGFRGVTMDDLAADLGISKKTLYAHFASKADLLAAVIHAKFRDLETDLDRRAAADPPDFTIRLQLLLECLQGHLQEPQPPCVRDMQREPDVFRWIQTHRRDLVRRHFGRLIDEGRRAGVIRRDVPSNVVIEILLGAIEGAVKPQKLAELGLTPKRAYTMIVNVVLHGILTDKGRTPL